MFKLNCSGKESKKSKKKALRNLKPRGFSSINVASGNVAIARGAANAVGFFKGRTRI